MKKLICLFMAAVFPSAAYADAIGQKALGLAAGNIPITTFAKNLATWDQRGTDLQNPVDPDVTFGRSVSQVDGTLVAAPAYVATGYIPVQEGATYNTVGAVLAKPRAYYDVNKVFVSGVYDFATSPITIPTGQGIAYVRFSVPQANWETLKINKQSTAQLVYDTVGNRPLVDTANWFWLRQTHSLLAGLALGESLQLIINLDGDSYTHGAQRFVTRLTNYLTSKFGDAGGGWCGFGFLTGGTPPWTTGNQPTYLNGNARPAVYTTYAYGNVTSSYYTENTTDLAAASLTQSGDAYEVNFPASPTISGIDLHWVATAAGQIRYGYGTGANPVTPGAWTTLNVSGVVGTTTVTSLSLTGMTQAGTLRIEWVSGTAKLAGVNLKSTANGVRINKIAATGTTISPWATATSNANFLTSYNNLNANTFVWMGAGNDETGVPFTSYANSMITLITNIKANYPGGDILIMMPPETNRSNNYPIEGYTNLVRNIALENKVAFDVVRFGDGGITSEYASGGALPLLDPDNLHPNAMGSRMILAKQLRMLLPWGSP